MANEPGKIRLPTISTPWDPVGNWREEQSRQYIQDELRRLDVQADGLNFLNLSGAVSGDVLVADSAGVFTPGKTLPSNYGVSGSLVVGGSGSVSGSLTIKGTYFHKGTRAGYYNTSPVIRGPALLQDYSTADRTLSSYTPDTESVAYTGIASGVAGTPYAQLTDINALRTAYENLRAFTEDLAQFTNSLVDELQRQGHIRIVDAQAGWRSWLAKLIRIG